MCAPDHHYKQSGPSMRTLLFSRRTWDDLSDLEPVATRRPARHHSVSQPHDGPDPMNLPPDKQREMLRQMLTIRRFEERASADYLAGRIYGVVHCYIGERSEE